MSANNQIQEVMFALRSEEPPRKRQRKARACEQCRSRKVGCDQGLPCGPCRRSRDALSCNYRDFDPSKADVAEVSHSSNAGPEPNISDTTAGQAHLESPGLAAYDKTVRKLQERVRRLENAQVLKQPPREVRGSDASTTTLGLTVNPIAPRLRSTPAKVRLFGQSHWMHVAEKIQGIGTFDSDAEPRLGQDNAEFSKAFKELRSLRSAVKAQQQPITNDLISISNLHGTFPPRKECDTLVEGYLRTFEKLYRIVHVPTFLEQYARFWENATAVPKVFIANLALILAIGVAFTSPKTINSDSISLRRKAQQWVYTVQWWLTGPTEKATHTLQASQAFCLLLLARQVNGMGNSPSLSPASLLSMAMQMGLHRNSQRFPNLSDFQAEMRSRLWATVVELYLPSVLDHSTPMMIDLEAVDAKPPSDINDSDLTDGATSRASHVPGDVKTGTSIQLLLLKSQKLRIRAIQILSDVRMQTSYETVVDLANQLRSACTEVAAFFQTRASDLGPETVFHRKYIDMYLRRHILLLHRPFMLQAQRDPRFYLSRKTCLESCMIMASYTDMLNLPLAELDDFSGLMVHGSGHFRGGLSLDVIVTLAFEVITQLQEDGPSHTPEQTSYDPARELARAAREPILRRLQHIQKQLLQVIALGNPSLKRSGIITALLSYIKALETGGNVKTIFYEATKGCVEKCSALLQAIPAAHPSQAQETREQTPVLSDEFDFDFENLDFDTLIDPMNLFSVPILDG